MKEHYQKRFDLNGYGLKAFLMLIGAAFMFVFLCVFYFFINLGEYFKKTK